MINKLTINKEINVVTIGTMLVLASTSFATLQFQVSANQEQVTKNYQQIEKMKSDTQDIQRILVRINTNLEFIKHKLNLIGDR